MKINYDDLDEMYANLPTRENVRKSTDPVGSLTDNRRKVLPNLNGAKNRKFATYGRKRKYEWDTGCYVDSDVWGMQLPPLLRLDQPR
jgi:hypothetical protein